MDVESDQNWPLKKRRKERKSCEIKEKKAHGEEHINHVGKTVPKVVTGEDCRYVKLNLIYNNLTLRMVFT